MKFMEKAVRFDGDLNQVEVKYHLEIHNISGIQLQMVLEAMEVVNLSHFYTSIQMCVFALPLIYDIFRWLVF